MDIYLIDYLCKIDKDVWTGKSLVKAKNAVHAWDKFRKEWDKDLEKGKIDVPVSAIKKYSVERICSKNEVLI